MSNRLLRSRLALVGVTAASLLVAMVGLGMPPAVAADEGPTFNSDGTFAPYAGKTTHGTAAGLSHHVKGDATEAPARKKTGDGIVRSPQEFDENAVKPPKTKVTPEPLDKADRLSRAESAAFTATMADAATDAPHGAPPAEADADSTAAQMRDPKTTGPRDGHYDPATSLEVPGKRTVTSKTFRNDDGTFTLQASTTPINYKNADGHLVPLDLDLTAANGRLHAGDNAVGLSLGGQADDTMSSLDLGNGATLTMDLVGAAAVPAERAGTTKVRYPQALPGATLELTSVPGGVKENIVLDSPAAGNVFDFRLGLTGGLEAQVRDDAKSVRIVKDDKILAVIPPGVMTDSVGGPDGEGALSGNITYSISTMPRAGTVLRVTADEDWLNDPARVFPVTVDPTSLVSTFVPSSANDTWIESGKTGPFYAYNEVKLGKDGTSTRVARAFVKFDLSSIPNARVTNTRLDLYEHYSLSCTPRYFQLHRVSTYWEGTSLSTYNQMPAFDANYFTSKTFAHGFSSSCPASWEYFTDVPGVTNMVTQWTNGTYPNFGFMMRATDETLGDARKGFISSEGGGMFLSVTYNPYSAIYSAAGWTQNTRPFQSGILPVTVTNTGAATWTPGNFSLVSRPAMFATWQPAMYRSTPLPYNIAPGQSVTLNAVVAPLGVTDPNPNVTGDEGNPWIVRFDMSGPNGLFSENENVYGYDLSVTVPNTAPAVTAMSPASGTHTTTLTPTVTATATDLDAYGYGVSYRFKACTDPATPATCTAATAYSGSPSWTIPAGIGSFNNYTWWQVQASDGIIEGPWSGWSGFIPSLTDPASSLGKDPYTSAHGGVNPSSGNYTASASDISVGTAGPNLTVDRTYNSLGDGGTLFGAGWSSTLDMNATAGSGGSNPLITYGDGRKQQFGANADGSYSPAGGYSSKVTGALSVNDTFTRTNATSLGTADSGHVWTASRGIWATDSAGAYLASGTGESQALVRGSADGTLSFDTPVAQNLSGVVFRGKDLDNGWRFLEATPYASLVIQKVVAGQTVIWDGFFGCCGPNDHYEIVMKGSSIDIRNNGNLIKHYDDAQFSDAPYVGLVGYDPGVGRIDNFKMASTLTLADSAGTYGFDTNGHLASIADRSGHVQTLQRHPATGNLQRIVDETSGRTINVTTNSAGAATAVSTTNTSWSDTFPSTGTAVALDPAWAVQGGTWSAVNGAAGQTGTSAGQNIALRDAGSDGTVKWHWTNVDYPSAVGFRMVDRYNGWYAMAAPYYGVMYIRKVVNGVETFADAIQYGCCGGAGTEFSVAMNGSSIDFMLDGVVRGHYDDPQFSTASKVAMASPGATTHFDDISFTAPVPAVAMSHTYAYTGGRLASSCIVGTPDRCTTYNMTTGPKPQLTSQTLPKGNQPVAVTYDPTTRKVASITNAAGTWNYTYTGSLGVAHTMTVTDPAAKTLVFAYDDKNKLTSTTNELGKVTSYTYDTRGYMTRRTDPLGHYTDYGISTSGQLVRVTTCRSASDCQNAYADLYDSTQVNAPNVADGTDTSGNLTGFEPNAPVNPTSDPTAGAARTGTRALRTSITTSTPAYTPLAMHNLRLTRPGQKFTFSAWAKTDVPNLAPQVYATLIYRHSDGSWTWDNGTVTTLGTAYTQLSVTGAPPADVDLVQVRVQTAGTSPLGKVNVFLDDFTTSVADPTNPFEGVPLTTRDARSSGPTDNTYATTFAYDRIGSPTKVNTPGGRTTTTAYTTGTEAAFGTGTMPAGLPKSTADPMGRTTTLVYDKGGDLRTVTDPAGAVTRYDYDPIGRVVTTTVTADGKATATTVTYNGYGEKTSVLYPQTTDAVTDTIRRAKTEWTYDVNGQQLTETQSDANDASVPVSTQTTTYDAMDRPATQTDPNGKVTTLAYGTLGRLRDVTDPSGRIIRTTYTATGAEAASTLIGYTNPVTGAAARDIVLYSLAYDNAGRLATDTDVLGRTTAYTYFDNDMLATETLLGYHEEPGVTPATRDIVLAAHTYDATGQEMSLTINGGRTRTNYTFNPDGQLSSQVTDPSGLAQTVAYSYDNSGLVTTATATATGTARARVMAYGYDSAGRLITTDRGDGVTSLRNRVWYTQSGAVDASLDERSSGPGDTAYRTDYTYDDRDNLVTVTAPPQTVETLTTGPVTARPVTRIGRDAWGQVTRVQDPAGNISKATFDPAGQPLTSVEPTYTPPGGSPLVPTTATTYTPTGQIATITQPDGTVIGLTYDSLDRIVQAERRTPGQAAGLGRKTTITYDDAGNAVTTVATDGSTTYATFDDLDRTRTSTIAERYPTAVNATTAYSYNDSSDIVKVLDAGNRTSTLAYNAVDELTGVTDPAGILTTLEYGNNMLNRVVEGAGHTTAFTYDPYGRQTAAAEYAGPGFAQPMRTTGTEYDNVGNPITTIDGLGTRTTRTFDAGNVLTALTQPTAAGVSYTETYGHDLNGNRTRSTDGRGNATMYDFTSGGRPQTTQEPSTTAYPLAADRKFVTVYDVNGRVVREDKAGAVTVNHTYDAKGRETGTTGTGAASTTPAQVFGYDELDRLTSAQVVGKTAQTFTYNDRGDILTSAGPAGTSSFTYSTGDDLTARTDAAGAASFTYDSAGRVATTTVSGLTVTNSYDTQGRLGTQRYGAGGALRTFGYDGLDRLSSDSLATNGGASLHATTYGFDAENLTGRTVGPAGVAGAGTYTYGHDLDQRLTSWTGPAGAGETFTYDNSGNRTTVNGVTATYDQRNRLLTKGTDTTYTYTARGTRKTQKIVNSTTTTLSNAYDQMVTDGSVTNSYDGLGRLAGVTQSGQTAIAMSYAGMGTNAVSDGTVTYGQDLAGNPLTTTAGGVTTATLTNAHGDVFAALNTAAQTLTASRAYTPYGTVQATVGTMPGKKGYQGDYTATNGLVDMQARWYDPNTAAFTGRDSVEDGLNRFAYVGGSPMMANDPTGHKSADGTVSFGRPGAGVTRVSLARGGGSSGSTPQVVRPAIRPSAGTSNGAATRATMNGVNAEAATNARSLANAAIQQASARAAAANARNADAARANNENDASARQRARQANSTRAQARTASEPRLSVRATTTTSTTTRTSTSTTTPNNPHQCRVHCTPDPPDTCHTRNTCHTRVAAPKVTPTPVTAPAPAPVPHLAPPLANPLAILSWTGNETPTNVDVPDADTPDDAFDPGAPIGIGAEEEQRQKDEEEQARQDANLAMRGCREFGLGCDTAAAALRKLRALEGRWELTDDLARLANQHVTGTGDTVLGRHPGYITKAESKGASYFDIGDDWNLLVARGQDPWALNQHFLDGRIAAGDRVLLSVPKGDIVPGTYLAREVQYLTGNGYRWVNQWSLRPGG